MVEKLLQGNTDVVENLQSGLAVQVPPLVYFDISPFCFCKNNVEANVYSNGGMEKIKRILKILKAEKVNNVVFTGNINSRDDVSEVICYSKRLKFETFFLSGNSVLKVVSYSNEAIEYEGLGFFKKRSKNSSGRLFCGAGYISCHICSCGMVYPCLNFSIICGSLFESDLSDIWKNSSFMNHFRSMKGSNCDDCKIYV